MITLAWGGMWENTPGEAPFPYEPFPSELAITQQPARVREDVRGPQPQKAWGLPLCSKAVSLLGATQTVTRPCVLWASRAAVVAALALAHVSAFAGCSNPG